MSQEKDIQKAMNRIVTAELRRMADEIEAGRLSVVTSAKDRETREKPESAFDKGIVYQELTGVETLTLTVTKEAGDD